MTVRRAVGAAGLRLVGLHVARGRAPRPAAGGGAAQRVGDRHQRVGRDAEVELDQVEVLRRQPRAVVVRP